MKRLTYRDNEGRAQWAPELLEDDTGMAGSVIRSFVADVEDILGDEYDLDRLRIGSPSKLMRDEIGKWLPRGMAEGIEDETKSANWYRRIERDGAW